MDDVSSSYHYDYYDYYYYYLLCYLDLLECVARSFVARILSTKFQMAIVCVCVRRRGGDGGRSEERDGWTVGVRVA